MQSTSVAPWQQNHLCFSHIPKFHLSQHRKISLNCQIKDYSQTLSTDIIKSQPSPDKKRAFLEQLYFSFEDPDQINHTQVGKIEKDQKGVEILEKDQKGIEKIEKNQKGIEEYKSVGFLLKMWWADLKAALGQRINVEGIVGSVSVIARDRHLVLPHVAVRDIRHIDWVALKESGFRGVVFDKDNTITAPYSLTLWPPLQLSIGQCKSVFGNNIAVFSNSAGLSEFDPDGRKARALESAIGIKVVRHRVKKPAGTAEEIEKLLGCESSKLIMVGDRPFTDIVFGNRNGFLTILTGPLSLSEEPFIVKQVRKLEIAFVNLWSNRGLKPMSHRLLTDVVQCVKDPRSL